MGLHFSQRRKQINIAARKPKTIKVYLRDLYIIVNLIEKGWDISAETHPAATVFVCNFAIPAKHNIMIKV